MMKSSLHGSPNPNNPESPSNDDEIANSKFISMVMVCQFLSGSKLLAFIRKYFIPLEVQLETHLLIHLLIWMILSSVLFLEPLEIAMVTFEEFDVWFFKVPESGKDLYSGEPVFFNLERMKMVPLLQIFQRVIIMLRHLPMIPKTIPPTSRSLLEDLQAQRFSPSTGMLLSLQE